MAIAIAGAGMAGLATATLLQRAGHQVQLYDQSPAPAPVGSGLVMQPVGLAVLDVIGCRADVEARGARIDRLFGRVQPSGKTVLDVTYGAPASNRYGVAVHRASLFDALLSAAEEGGASICHGRIVTGVESGKGGSWLTFQEGRRAGPFDLVIDALGSRSVLSPEAGRDLTYGALWASLDWPVEGPFDAATLEQRYEKATRMVGVLPIGLVSGNDERKTAFFWSLKQDQYRAWRDAPLDQWKEEVLALWPESQVLLDQITTHDDMVMARYRHRTIARPVSGRVVHIGDSAHAASPQLGQGANMALLDALALSIALARQPDLDTALGEYVRLRMVHVRLYQAISHVFTPFYQSDSAALSFLRDYLMAPASRLSPMQVLLSAMVSGILGMPLTILDRKADSFSQEAVSAE